MSNILTNNINPRSGNLITIGGANDRVSIAGTLSYEDVSNIDSVGIITAQSGIKVPGGSVAIGLDTTQAPLHVKSSVARASIVESTSTDGSYTSFVDPSTSSYDRVQIGSAGNDLVLRTTEVERVRIDSSGRVLIGATSTISNNILVVAGTTDGNPGFINLQTKSTSPGSTDQLGGLNLGTAADVNTSRIMALRDSGTWTAGSSTPTAISFQTTSDGSSSAAERMRIDSSGRLLVGTTTAPSVGIPAGATFVVQGYVGSTTGDSLISLQRGQAPASISSGAQLGAITFGANDGSPYAQIHAATDGSGGSSDYPGRLVFSTTADTGSAPTERLRIDSSGAILLGATTVTYETRLKVQGTNTAEPSGTIRICRDDATPNDQQFLGSIQIGDSSELPSANVIARRGGGTWSGSSKPGELCFGTAPDGATSPTERMRINATGQVYIGTQSSTATLGTGLHVKSGVVGTKYNTGGVTISGSGGDHYALSLTQNTTSTNAGFGFLAAFSPLVDTCSFGYCVGGSSANVTIWAANANGDFTVFGALSKSSGSFKIDHPLPAKTETHHLVHSFIEGPQADLIYRGQVTLVDGTATVNIDTAGRMTEGTFVLLNTNVSCFTSNETDWTPVRGSVSGNVLTIEAQDNTSTATVSWMVVGERHDQHMKDTDWTDENGRVITEPLKEV